MGVYLDPRNKPNDTPTTLYNPDIETFVFPWDGGKETYTLEPKSHTDVPKYVANRMASQLADKIIGKDGVRLSYEVDKKRLLATILV